MRFFVKQTNDVVLPALLDQDDVPITTATVTAKLFDPDDTLVTGSDIPLGHVSAGRYEGEWPAFDIVPGTKGYQIEITAVVSSKTVFYTKQPILPGINGKDFANA